METERQTPGTEQRLIVMGTKYEQDPPGGNRESKDP